MRSTLAASQQLTSVCPPPMRFKNKLLPGAVELGQNVVEQQHRRLAGLGEEYLPLGELQGERRRACLSLGGIAPRVRAVDGDQKIVLMRADETETALDLRAAQLALPFETASYISRSAAAGSSTAETVV